MKRIFIPLTILAMLSIAFSGCNHGIAKNLENANDTVDTVLVDTVEADSIIYDEEYGDIRYYEDEYLYFRYPSEYQCVEAENGATLLLGDSQMHNYMAFTYYELRPNETVESAVKLMTMKALQAENNAELTYSSDIPVLPETEGIKETYVTIINVDDEKEPAVLWITGNLLKNGHFHVSTARTTNEHDNKMFQAILKTVVMR
ncbi:MAG: hypothetical protein IJV10_00990 [Prevotella sp.]|nr:hypothetical protein [Prevotella sp.]